MNTKPINLSGRHGSGKFATVDAADYERLSCYTWHYAYGYAYRTAYIDDRKTTVRLHREVLGVPTVRHDAREVDHVNGDRLDNRRSNLRLVTRSQNGQNVQGARSDSSTGVRGVFRARRGRYRARIWIDGRWISLGQYATIKEAGEAAEEGRRTYMTHAPECAGGVTK